MNFLTGFRSVSNAWIMDLSTPYLVGWTGGAPDREKRGRERSREKLELGQLRYIVVLAVDRDAAERTAQRHVCSPCRNALLF